MTPQEVSGPTSARPEQSNTDEAEEINLKYNFIKMIETVIKEIKNSLKERKHKPQTKNRRNQ